MMRVLFLCTHNSCRSQMAEGWTRKLKRGEIEAWSAGTEPSRVDPIAVKVMAEAGVDISYQRSKHIQEVIHIPFDAVITLCGDARDRCPVFPGESVLILHHCFEDPSQMEGTEEAVLRFFRKIRDDIKFFVDEMPGNLDYGKL